MKKRGLAFGLFLSMLVFAFGDDTLDQAIEKSVKHIETDLDNKTPVVVLNFVDAANTGHEALNTRLSAYVVEKIEGKLTQGKKLTVINRSSSTTTFQELIYQNSGNVTDDAAAQLGKQEGAKSVITGKLRKMGEHYLYTLVAINVESTRQESYFDTYVKLEQILKSLGVLDEKELLAQAKKEEKELLAQAKKDDKETRAWEKEISRVSRSNRIVLGARGALAFLLDKPVEGDIFTETDYDVKSFYFSQAYSAYLGINSITNTFGARLEGSFLMNNGMKDVRSTGVVDNTFWFSYPSIDISFLVVMGFAEQFSFSLYAGPYTSLALGNFTLTVNDQDITSMGGEKAALDNLFGPITSWGGAVGASAGIKLGIGYLYIDGRFFYDFNNVKIKIGDSSSDLFRRSGVLAGIGYEFWL
ncbi:MAG: penicillin-binding protein activator LpoB [Treponema sp.]|jgi:TolB-like protein|nr:penicillin-binding protein activator LpoB [Treponema sp.]